MEIGGTIYGKKEHILIFLRSITKYADSTIEKYADSTIEKLYLQLQRAFALAVNKKIIKENLMLDEDLVRPKSKKPTKEIVSLTQEQQKIFLGEKSIPFLNETTKTDAGRRDIPFTEAIEKLLREVIAESKPNPENLLFYDYNNMKLITTNQVNSFFNRICKKAGLEITGQHALRHTFATRCIEAGVEAIVLKKWMGHTDIHVTLDTYADVSDSMHNNSINKLEAHMITIV